MTSPLLQRCARIAASLIVTLSLAGCGTAAKDTDGSHAATESSSQPFSGGPGGQGGPGFPGASGEVVAQDGDTAQVRNQRSGQVAVSWTDATTFTRAVAGRASDIEVGDCVVVMGAEGDAAESVRVSEAVDGSCTTGVGFGGGPGGRPGGGPGGDMPSDVPRDRPSDRPSDMPTDRPRDLPGGGRGDLVVGKVTQASDASVTVAAMVMGRPGESNDEQTEPETEDTTVRLGDSTTITTQASAEASDVKLGVCVSAQGESDDTGAVTATTVAVSDPVDGECGMGFGAGRGAPPAGGTQS